MDDLRAALAAGDASRLQRVAHTLKGSADVLGATAVVEAAQSLELIGRDQAMDQADAGLEQLELEVNRLLRALRAMIQSTPV
jgi:HPt (histidine-containing phosphotransfer) domain-containing protein